MEHQQQPALSQESPTESGQCLPRGAWGNQARLAQLDVPPDPAVGDLLGRLDNVLLEWERAIATDEVEDAELALAGLKPVLNQLAPVQQEPAVAQALACALAVVGADGEPSAETVLRQAFTVTRRLGEHLDAHGVDGTMETATETSRELTQDLVERVNALHAAIENGDVSAVHRLLSTADAALRQAYLARHGQVLELAIKRGFGGREQALLLATAQHGPDDIVSRFLALTRDIAGEDEDALFVLLETATVADRARLVADPEVRRIIATDLGERERARVDRCLAPLYGNDALGPEDRAAQLAALEEAETRLDHRADSLLIRLRAREGRIDDDEDAMLEDVRAWALQFPEGHADLDPDAGRPAELAEVLAYLDGQLSERQLAEACNLLRTGGKPSLTDRLDEAAADTTLLFFPNTNEGDMYGTLVEASAAERRALADDPSALAGVFGALDPDERYRARMLLTCPLEGSDLRAVDAILAELDALGPSGDRALYDAVEQLSPQGVAWLLATPRLKSRLESSTSDAPALQALMGPPGQAEGGEPQADNERLVSRLEHALGGAFPDQDSAFRAVLEWQEAGGQLDGQAQPELTRRARAAVQILPHVERVKLENALDGLATLTWQDRLDAGTRLRVDDQAVDDTLEELPDETLLLEWSNLDVFADRAAVAQADADFAALEAFVPDLSPRITARLESYRADAVTLAAELRQRLEGLLACPHSAALARERFGYIPTADDIERLRYTRVRSVHAEQRDGPWNAVSTGVMDTFDASGPAYDQAQGTYHGAVSEALGPKRGPGQREAVEQAYARVEAEGGDYRATKRAVAATASAVVEVAVAAIATLVSGGASAGLLATVVGSFSGGLAGELTKAAMLGEETDLGAAAEDLAMDVLGAVIDHGLGKVADGLHQRLSATEVSKGFYGWLDAKAGAQISGRIADAEKAVLKSSIQDIPSELAASRVESEILLRSAVEVEASSERLTKAGLDVLEALLSPTRSARGDAVADLTRSGGWDGASERLATLHRIDIVVLAAAEAIASGKSPTPAQLTAVLCKLAGAGSAAANELEGLRADRSEALKFYNDVSPEALASLATSRTAQALVGARGEAGFTSLDEVMAVPGVKRDLIAPAAAGLVAEWQRLRHAESTPDP